MHINTYMYAGQYSKYIHILRKFEIMIGLCWGTAT